MYRGPCDGVASIIERVALEYDRGDNTPSLRASAQAPSIILYGLSLH